MTSEPRTFFGWWVALGLAVVLFLSTGIRYTIGPFLKPVVADLGIDRTAFSLVVSLSVFLFGAFMPVVGRIVDRIGARPVIVSGAFVLAGCLAVTGFATTLTQLFVLYGVGVALGLAATGQPVAFAVVSRWFARRRATALSILGGASMAGMGVLVPLAMWSILTIGWRWTFVAMGAATLLVVLPLALLVVRESPEAMGLRPDGAAASPDVPDDLPERTDAAAAAHTLAFWQLAGGLFVCGLSMSLLSAHGLPMLTDHGFAAMTASWALGLLGAASVVFTILIGILADRFGRRPALASVYVARAVAFAGLFLVRDDVSALLLVAFLSGASMAGSLSLTSALTADIFGRFSVGSVFGAVFFIHQVGAALGSWLGGYLFEVTGGYGLIFAVTTATLAVAALVTLGLDDRQRDVGELAPAARRRYAA